MWAVYAHGSSAIAAVLASEKAEVDGGACAAVRDGGNSYRAEAGSSRAEGEPRTSALHPQAEPLPQLQPPPQRDPTASALATFASGLCFH